MIHITRKESNPFEYNDVIQVFCRQANSCDTTPRLKPLGLNRTYSKPLFTPFSIIRLFTGRERQILTPILQNLGSLPVEMNTRILHSLFLAHAMREAISKIEQ